MHWKTKCISSDLKIEMYLANTLFNSKSQVPTTTREWQQCDQIHFPDYVALSTELYGLRSTSCEPIKKKDYYHYYY